MKKSNQDQEYDSSEDDDYVPNAKAIEKTEKEIGLQNGYVQDDNGPKTGLDLIKQKRRERETDDLWEMMQMDEDPIYKKKLE